jgi:hypothetical protein
LLVACCCCLLACCCLLVVADSVGMKSLKQSIGRSFKKGSTASMTKWEIYSKLEELIEEDKMEETQMVLLELSSADRASIVAFPGDRDWTVLHHVSKRRSSFGFSHFSNTGVKRFFFFFFFFLLLLFLFCFFC